MQLSQVVLASLAVKMVSALTYVTVTHGGASYVEALTEASDLSAPPGAYITYSLLPLTKGTHTFDKTLWMTVYTTTFDAEAETTEAAATTEATATTEAAAETTAAENTEAAENTQATENTEAVTSAAVESPAPTAEATSSRTRTWGGRPSSVASAVESAEAIAESAEAIASSAAASAVESAISSAIESAVSSAVESAVSSAVKSASASAVKSSSAAASSKAQVSTYDGAAGNLGVAAGVAGFAGVAALLL